MIAVGLKSWLDSSIKSWDTFWFTPRLPHALAVLRIATGLMLLYSHLVLATDLMSFLGDDAWINNETSRGLHDGAFGFSDWGRTYLWYISNPLLLWMHHGLTILVTACFAAGLLTRITAPAAWFLQVVLLHRLTGTLFGLDQIVTYSAMYLMLSPCGSWISVDAWLRDRLGARLQTDRSLAWLFPEATPSVAANVATRLLQLHLCVIYFFGGLAKARGTSWWDGTAIWYSAGNFEYQSWDLTWISKFPRIASALAHLTLFWEVSYIALVWPRLTRPIVLATAVAVHAGIALFLGMMTFGAMMIAANLVFVNPNWLLRSIGRPMPDDDIDDVNEVDKTLLSAEAIDAADDDDEWEDDLTLDDDAGKSSLGMGSSILTDSDIQIDKPVAGQTDAQRAVALEALQAKLRNAARHLRKKQTKLSDRETKYRERVRRLKEREAQIKELVDRHRESKKKTDES